MVGLGNPGDRYAGTRHNAGHRVVERLWKAHAEGPIRQAGGCEYRAGAADPFTVIMARPLSYMNECGGPVATIVALFQVSLDGVLVVHDDMDLAVGALRVRYGGSSGGHRGIRSIQEALGDDGVARLKIGIGHPGEPGADVVDFVLSTPPAEEAAILATTERLAADAAWLWVTEGIERCMNRFNRRAVGAEEGEH